MGLSKKDYYVRDLVIDDEYGVIDSDATVQAAAKEMKKLGVPDLVVIEKKSDKVLGVIADFDIVQNVVAEGIDSKTANVKSTMYAITPVTLDTPVTEAFTRMRDLQVNVVPVIENDKLVGVCSIQDCWSYIPDKNVDEIGLIPVANTRVAEFWFASVCSVLAFVMGIIFPLVGIFGFFSATQSDLMNLFGMADVRGGQVTFYLFEARGVDFLVPLLNLIARNGAIWLLIVICSILLLVFGIFGLFSLIYSSLSDTRNIRTGKIVRMVIPGLIVVFIILEWIFYLIAFLSITPPVSVSVDGVGLVTSIISILLIFAAINRDYIFRQKEVSS